MPVSTSPASSVGFVVYQVYVNGKPLSDIPLDVRVEQTWGQHDLVSVRIEYNRMRPAGSIYVWPDNAPVTIVWGRRPQTLNTWYGYVNHHQYKSNASSGTHNNEYTYFCVGTSKPMNTETSRFWGNVTPTYIAKQIAANHRLRAVVTSTNLVLANEMQANMSDFDFMNYVAGKTGYRFWVSGGTLYFIDPAAVLYGTSGQAVPVFYQDKLLTQQDTLRDFDMLQGDNLPGSTVATRQMYGIDSTTGHVFQASTGSGSVVKANTSRMAGSLGEANLYLSAWQSLSQFWIGATAEVFGSTTLYPGKVVNLQGTGLAGGNAGYWIVVSAKHVLLSSGNQNPANDKYATQLVIMRNTSASIPVVRGVVPISPEFTSCMLSNGVWQSVNQSVVVEGVVNG